MITCYHVNIALIAQLDSALDYGSRGFGFESRSGHDMHAWWMHWKSIHHAPIEPVQSDCNQWTQWLHTALRRMWTARLRSSSRATCIPRTWKQDADRNEVLMGNAGLKSRQGVRFPAIPLADVVKLGITRDSYSRIAVQIRRPLRFPSNEMGHNRFLAMWTYGNMRSYGIVFLPRIMALRRSLEPLIVVRIHGKEPFWTKPCVW